MDSRSRVLKALNKECPDRIPIDLGTTNCTTMTKFAYENLKKYLGIESETKIMQENFQVVFIDEEILEKFDIDTRGIHPQSICQKHIVIDDNTFINLFGTKFRMPENGLYYDMVEFPLSGKTLDEIKEFPWPDPAKSMDLTGIKEKAKKLYYEEKYCLVGDPIDVGIFENCWFLRSFEEFLMDLLINPDIATFLLEKVLEYELGRYKLFLQEVGEYLDVVFMGDDIASSENIFMKIQTYRDIVKPYHKQFVHEVKKMAPQAKLMFHCCGSISPLIPDLVEIGVDILNPVQVSAKAMEAEFLKEKFGRDIVFWGGIDTTKVLPYGAPDEVRKEVQKMIKTLGPAGYVLTAVHDIQPDVPAENVCAMFEEAKQYNLLKT